MHHDGDRGCDEGRAEELCVEKVAVENWQRCNDDVRKGRDRSPTSAAHLPRDTRYTNGRSPDEQCGCQRHGYRDRRVADEERAQPVDTRWFVVPDVEIETSSAVQRPPDVCVRSGVRIPGRFDK